MGQIRLRETRKTHGLTVRALAELAGVDHTTVSRIESGERRLSVQMAQKFASALNTTAAQLLGIDDASVATAAGGGLSQPEAVPYEWQDNGGAMPLVLHRGAKDTVFAYTVASSSLDELSYRPGDIVLVDIGQAAVDALKSGQCVVAQHYGSVSAATLLRQFIAPHLLITNSRRHNLAPLNLEADDVAIKGVIIGQYTPRTA
jgi:transcriptional regulator with XRE-family HTH domain